MEVNYTCYCDHFVIYKYIISLRHTHETNIMLYGNYASIHFFKIKVGYIFMTNIRKYPKNKYSKEVKTILRLSLTL